MRKLDEILRDWRVAKASPYVRRGDRLLDVGCFDGYLIDRFRDRVTEAVGIDPIAQPCRREGVEIIRDTFPGRRELPENHFDCVTLMAVLEHVPDAQMVAAECFRLLKPEGRVIVTVPSPLVDSLLGMLEHLRLIDGLCTEQHHGFDVGRTFDVFRQAGFDLIVQRRFQLGLNNLFVFAKPRVRVHEAAELSEPHYAEEAELVGVG